jgi:hypothetical protein
MPNVTTDVGLSPPYNSIFTFFGQFFDHGVDQTVKSGATVYVPLRDDDPLVTLGPDGKANSGDEVPASQRFMVLTRAQNQPGPDGILGNADDEQNANNTDTPWVDQSQTYTSHPSHQVFLREYAMNAANHPVDTGKLLGDPSRASISPGDTGMATWRSVKEQARTKLGLLLGDKDALDIPMIAVDPYGNFEPGPARGLPQYVTKTPTTTRARRRSIRRPTPTARSRPISASRHRAPTTTSCWIRTSWPVTVASTRTSRSRRSIRSSTPSTIASSTTSRAC